MWGASAKQLEVSGVDRLTSPEEEEPCQWTASGLRVQPQALPWCPACWSSLRRLPSPASSLKPQSPPPSLASTPLLSVLFLRESCHMNEATVTASPLEMETNAPWLDSPLSLPRACVS